MTSSQIPKRLLLQIMFFFQIMNKLKNSEIKKLKNSKIGVRCMAEEPTEDLTDEERAVLNEVVKAGEKGVLPEDVAKKLKMPVNKIIEILERFEEEGWFYSEEED